MMAGLPEINLSDSMPSVSLQEVREQCEEVLNKADKQLLYYYYLHWDCQNIVKLLKNPDAELEIFGNFTMDQYQDLLTSAREMNFNVHRPQVRDEVSQQDDQTMVLDAVGHQQYPDGHDSAPERMEHR